MKSLTIEELKALVGDWVWLPEKDAYAKIIRNDGDYFVLAIIVGYSCTHICRRGSDYGTAWFAYKNREQAQCEGQIVELPPPFIDEGTNANDETIYMVFRSIIDTYCPSEDIFTDKPKAEKRLAGLLEKFKKGELKIE